MRARNLFERVFMPPPMLADKAIWRTSKGGKHYQVDTETGEILKGNIGQREWNSPAMQNARRDKIEDAMRNIANGKEESTIPGLRNDLEQYGGTNDVTIVKGNAKKGLVHIAERHGQQVIPFVLEAVANGEFVRFSRANKTVALQKDGYEALLSLEEYGKKKTWLLTGYKALGIGQNKGASDVRGKFCPRHAPTHIGPTSSRPGMGAESPLTQIINEIFSKSKSAREDAPLPIAGPFRFLRLIKI